MAVQVVPMDAPLGAELTGLTVGRPLPAEVVDQLHAALDEHLLLVLRSERGIVGDDELVTFARSFGDLRLSVADHSRLAETPEINVVANVDWREVRGTGGAGYLDWHADLGFEDTPAQTSYIVLDAVETPATGGATGYVSLPRAYRELPAAIRDRAANARVRYGLNIDLDYLRADRERLATLGVVAAPLTYVNPRTHTPSICPNIGETHTVEIEGWAAGDAREFLAEVFDRVTAEPYRYEHTWQPGDIAIWNNLETMHCRTPFDPAERRIMRHLNVMADVTSARSL